MSDQFETQERSDNQPDESSQSAVAFHASRCQHIKVNGTQCGSPAVRHRQLCYFHERCRPAEIKVTEGDKTGEILLPAFEDASSIQFTLRQVAQMLLEQKITHKTAGLLLYTLQIASSNLKRMSEEKPRPTQVVVDPEKVEETPIGRTPWSASGQGHDLEEEADIAAARWVQQVNEEWEKKYRARNAQWEKRYRTRNEWLTDRAANLALWLDAQPERPRQELIEIMAGLKDSLEREAADMGRYMRPNTIQACAEAEQYVV
jgi:hypothetical protein